MEVIHSDRREDRRYPIELELQYRVVARRSPQQEGRGRTLNMSSGGILFSSDQNLPAGAFVELSIHWPILLRQTLPLTLMVVGRVVRSDDNRVAVKTNRYEFLTRPVRNPREALGGRSRSYLT